MPNEDLLKHLGKKGGEGSGRHKGGVTNSSKPNNPKVSPDFIQEMNIGVHPANQYLEGHPEEQDKTKKGLSDKGLRLASATEKGFHDKPIVGNGQIYVTHDVKPFANMQERKQSQDNLADLNKESTNKYNQFLNSRVAFGDNHPITKQHAQNYDKAYDAENQAWHEHMRKAGKIK